MNPLHIVSDGTTDGTKITDSSGNLVTNISKVEITIDVNKPLVDAKFEATKQPIDMYLVKEESVAKKQNKIVAFLEKLLK